VQLLELLKQAFSRNTAVVKFRSHTYVCNVYACNSSVLSTSTGARCWCSELHYTVYTLLRAICGT
jgi:hypothetical protein